MKYNHSQLQGIGYAGANCHNCGKDLRAKAVALNGGLLAYCSECDRQAWLIVPEVGAIIGIPRDKLDVATYPSIQMVNQYLSDVDKLKKEVEN